MEGVLQGKSPREVQRQRRRRRNLIKTYAKIAEAGGRNPIIPSFFSVFFFNMKPKQPLKRSDAAFFSSSNAIIVGPPLQRQPG